MNHLTSQQISEWIAGERIAGQEQHVSECRRCSEAVARMENLLAEFGDAYQDWGGAQFVDRPQPSWVRASRWWPRAAIASAVLAIAVAIPVLKQQRQHAAQIAMEDDALLTAVHSDVGRSVPSSMKPLAELTAPALSDRNTQ